MTPLSNTNTLPFVVAHTSLVSTALDELKETKAIPDTLLALLVELNLAQIEKVGLLAWARFLTEDFLMMYEGVFSPWAIGLNPETKLGKQFITDSPYVQGKPSEIDLHVQVNLDDFTSLGDLVFGKHSLYDLFENPSLGELYKKECFKDWITQITNHHLHSKRAYCSLSDAGNFHQAIVSKAAELRSQGFYDASKLMCLTLACQAPVVTGLLTAHLNHTRFLMYTELGFRTLALSAQEGSYKLDNHNKEMDRLYDRFLVCPVPDVAKAGMDLCDILSNQFAKNNLNSYKHNSVECIKAVQAKAVYDCIDSVIDAVEQEKCGRNKFGDKVITHEFALHRRARVRLGALCNFLTTPLDQATA